MNDDRMNSQSLPFVEELYVRYLHDPAAVPADWREYFADVAKEDPRAGSIRLAPSFGKGGTNGSNGSNGSRSVPADPAAVAARPMTPAARSGESPAHMSADVKNLEVALLQHRVNQLVRAYRVRGHMHAKLDPLGRERVHYEELTPEYWGLTSGDLDRTCPYYSNEGVGAYTVREILEILENTYCRSIGVQFYHIDDPHVKQWLQERMESTQNRIQLSRDQQLRIFTRLTDAVMFEEFIQKKYIGAKSFSLEGAESLIPLLDLAIEKAGRQGTEEIVLGMAHRGRLNVLANIMGKNPRHIFQEFEDAEPERFMGGGDVKYHLGYSYDWITGEGKKVHLSLCFNPSHLEFVNPVVIGRARAKQDREGDRARRRSMALLIHGDAAVAGEGIVQEVFNMSELRGYTVGGSIHIVVNNQIGFTTAPEQDRSSTYATDIAKMLQIPIFHVNGEDPEAVAQVIDLAMDFRALYQRDVVIDMYCYRRRGHNEGDEPTFTQPLLYRAIEKRKPVREGYLEHLSKLGGISPEKAEEIAVKRREHLENELAVARETERSMHPELSMRGNWEGYHGGPSNQVKEVDTSVERETLQMLLEKQARLPTNFKPNPKIVKNLELRLKMAEGERPLDWAAAEALAFASLATQGHRIRLTGQDAERGTFSQRHAVLHDFEDDHLYIPLQCLSEKQAPVEIYNSPLSEAAVLGFEYGFSLDYPDGLVLWEAQFGDFVNACQVIIDQFLVSAEDKWRRLSGLVLLLPHGFEGMGPEHSSARLERFLMSAAEDNIQVAVPSSPAQYFHLLRRQVVRAWRKPLIVMTPKSLLRNPAAVSSLEELSRGKFHKVMPDATIKQPDKVQRIILCSGKIYYELVEKRQAIERAEDVAIVRMEQLYPFPEEDLQDALAAYPKSTPVFWAQEEPRNMGAWPFLRARFCERLFGRHFMGVSRPESASPATGSANSHKLEQRMLLEKAFGA